MVVVAEPPAAFDPGQTEAAEEAEEGSAQAPSQLAPRQAVVDKVERGVEDQAHLLHVAGQADLPLGSRERHQQG